MLPGITCKNCNSYNSKCNIGNEKSSIKYLKSKESAQRIWNVCLEYETIFFEIIKISLMTLRQYKIPSSRFLRCFKAIPRWSENLP